MTYDQLFERLWIDYSNQNPSAAKIKALFEERIGVVVNDHIAIRTFDDERINVDALAKTFKQLGYVERGKYEFKQKKLRAKHFENPDIPNAPRVFISELKLNECSEFIRSLANDIAGRISLADLDAEDIVTKGVLWGKPSYEIYEKLREESEYAAWFYVHGFRANHFTISVNSFENVAGLSDINKLLEEEGYVLNKSGGAIKGSPEKLLEQSSIMADKVEVDFADGKHIVPACYYEFAYRYKDKNGKLFSGFIADSADKIFESTDFNK
jgi:hypothetical protein